MGKVLITGGSGFIGTNIREFLSEYEFINLTQEPSDTSITFNRRLL